MVNCRILYLLLAALLLPLVAQAQNLNSDQQSLMSEIDVYLQSLSIQPRRISPAEIAFESNDIPYLFTLSAQDTYPKFLTLQTTYNLPATYDPVLLQQTAARLNVGRGVKCTSVGQLLTFSAEWYLHDLTPVRTGFLRVREQVESLCRDFQRVYTEVQQTGAASMASGIKNGVPGMDMHGSAAPAPASAPAATPAASAPATVSTPLLAQNAQPAMPGANATPDQNPLAADVPAGSSDTPQANQPQATKEPAPQDGAESVGAPADDEPIIYEHPSVGAHDERRLTLDRVTLMPDRTILDFTSYNRSGEINDSWCSIQQNAYIRAGGQEYRLVGAERISISPKVTYYRSSDASLTFRLIFPPIPVATTSLDFADGVDSWWMKDIILR